MRNNYIHFKVWDEITYPFPEFNGETIEVCEWISNCLPLLGTWIIVYAGIKVKPCW